MNGFIGGYILDFIMPISETCYTILMYESFIIET